MDNKLKSDLQDILINFGRKDIGLFEAQNQIDELFNPKSKVIDLNSIPIYYQPDFGDDDTLVTPDGTELWSYYVYASKERAQKDFPDRKILEFSGDDIEDPYFIDDEPILIPISNEFKQRVRETLESAP